MASAGMSRPRPSNFFLYPARDLVELLVTKYIFLPRALSLSRVSGIPGMSESPWMVGVHFICRSDRIGSDRIDVERGEVCG